MIVVDTNIIAYFLIRGEKSKSVDRLFEFDSEWIAPGLWLDEFLNVLCTHERAGKMEAEKSVEILGDALALMKGASYDVRPERVLSVARRLGCSAYDSQYVVLAEDMGLKLYTCDRKLAERCPDLAVMPK